MFEMHLALSQTIFFLAVALLQDLSSSKRAKRAPNALQANPQSQNNTSMSMMEG